MIPSFFLQFQRTPQTETQARENIYQLRMLRVMLLERMELLRNLALGAQLWEDRQGRQGDDGPNNDVSFEDMMLLRAIQLSMETQQPTGPPPIVKADLENLEKLTISSEHVRQQQSCTICMQEMKWGTSATRLPCSHLYCTGCIQPWLEQHRTCPICRVEVHNVMKKKVKGNDDEGLRTPPSSKDENRKSTLHHNTITLANRDNNPVVTYTNNTSTMMGARSIRSPPRSTAGRVVVPSRHRYTGRLEDYETSSSDGETPSLSRVPRGAPPNNNAAAPSSHDNMTLLARHRQQHPIPTTNSEGLTMPSYWPSPVVLQHHSTSPSSVPHPPTATASSTTSLTMPSFMQEPHQRAMQNSAASVSSDHVHDHHTNDVSDRRQSEARGSRPPGTNFQQLHQPSPNPAMRRASQPLSTTPATTTTTSVHVNNLRNSVSQASEWRNAVLEAHTNTSSSMNNAPSQSNTTNNRYSQQQSSTRSTSSRLQPGGVRVVRRASQPNQAASSERHMTVLQRRRQQN